MERHIAQDAVILIPSLEPDERLPAYIRRLKEAGFGRIVVVDDGSSEPYQPIFREIEQVEDTIVLHHEVNRGKGVALKTGYRYILEHMGSQVAGVITADADGQHTVEDCMLLAGKLQEGKKALYLGSRDFRQENIPPKSRFGNRLTSVVFKLLYGQYLPDTQTGLRAFRREELPFMIDVEGERFEYEMKVLIACSRAGIPIIPVTIETIYENDNEGTHFHPIKDSLRIYKVIFGSFFKFMASSLTSVVVDQGLFNLLNLVVFSNGVEKKADLILASTVIARVFSSVFNFWMNRKMVFKHKGSAGKTFLRYVILSVIVMLLSAGGTWLLGPALPWEWLPAPARSSPRSFLPASGTLPTGNGRRPDGRTPLASVCCRPRRYGMLLKAWAKPAEDGLSTSRCRCFPGLRKPEPTCPRGLNSSWRRLLSAAYACG